MKTKIKTLILASLLTLGSVTANAVPVKWSVTGMTFDDGGTASGSFVYDADTGAYSQINIVTTAGSVLAGTTHIIEHFGFASVANRLIMLDFATGPYTGLATGLNITWNGALTNAGGSFGITFGREGVCTGEPCQFVNPLRDAGPGGNVTFVPEPGTLALLGIGLLGLALGRKKAVA